jgi:hypothetical protein
MERRVGSGAMLTGREPGIPWGGSPAATEKLSFPSLTVVVWRHEPRVSSVAVTGVQNLRWRGCGLCLYSAHVLI